MPPPFNSLVSLLKAFPDDAACRAHLEHIRWDGKPRCPHCGYDDKAYFVTLTGALWPISLLRGAAFAWRFESVVVAASRTSLA